MMLPIRGDAALQPWPLASPARALLVARAYDSRAGNRLSRQA